MTYTYSWEKTNTLSPLDFMQEQNDIWEDENSDDVLSAMIPIEDFDTDEIL